MPGVQVLGASSSTVKCRSEQFGWVLANWREKEKKKKSPLGKVYRD